MRTFIKTGEVENFGQGGPLVEACLCSRFGVGLGESSDLNSVIRAKTSQGEKDHWW